MSTCGRWLGTISALLLSVNAGWAGHEKLVQKVYQVADLVVPIETMSKEKGAAIPPVCTLKTPACTGRARNARSGADGADRLIEIVTSTIAPKSWADQGRAGTIHYHPMTMALVINQTLEIQDQIADLLTAMRRELETEVAVEVQFADVSADLVERLGLSEKKEKILKPKQMHRLMEEIQSDVRANVMQAPKLTTFNGQTARIDFTDEQHFVSGAEVVYRNNRLECRPKTETVPLGTKLEVRSVIAADRRKVKVQLNATLQNLASDDVPQVPVTISVPPQFQYMMGQAKPLTQLVDAPRIETVNVERTLSIADGHTAVLSGPTKEFHAVTVTKVPIVGDLPLIGSCFSSYSIVHFRRQLLVFVTPRIVVPAEKEQQHSCGSKHVEARSVYGIPPVRSTIEDNYGPSPDEARVLRALAKPIRLPGILEEVRDNVQIVVERLGEETDAPRSYPLIGSATVTHYRWKCTVYYTETMESQYPFAFRWTQPRTQVVCVDLPRLHEVSTTEARPK